MDNTKSDRELTSTMGNILSTSNSDEKNDTSDATPTSSTDANTTLTTSQIVSDDPISSTSSDLNEQSKIKNTKATEFSATMKPQSSDEVDKSKSVDPDADLLEISMPNEKITEDVEDLVHDLESLLEESTDSFNIPMKTKSPDISEVQNEQSNVGETVEAELTKIKDENDQTNLVGLDGDNLKTVESDKVPVESKVSDLEKEIENCSPTATTTSESNKEVNKEECVKNLQSDTEEVQNISDKENKSSETKDDQGKNQSTIIKENIEESICEEKDLQIVKDNNESTNIPEPSKEISEESEEKIAEKQTIRLEKSPRKSEILEKSDKTITEDKVQIDPEENDNPEENQEKVDYEEKSGPSQKENQEDSSKLTVVESPDILITPIAPECEQIDDIIKNDDIKLERKPDEQKNNSVTSFVNESVSDLPEDLPDLKEIPKEVSEVAPDNSPEKSPIGDSEQIVEENKPSTPEAEDEPIVEFFEDQQTDEIKKTEPKDDTNNISEVTEIKIAEDDDSSGENDESGVPTVMEYTVEQSDSEKSDKEETDPSNDVDIVSVTNSCDENQQCDFNECSEDPAIVEESPKEGSDENVVKEKESLAVVVEEPVEELMEEQRENIVEDEPMPVISEAPEVEEELKPEPTEKQQENAVIEKEEIVEKIIESALPVEANSDLLMEQTKSGGDSKDISDEYTKEQEDIINKEPTRIEEESMCEEVKQIELKTSQATDDVQSNEGPVEEIALKSAEDVPEVVKEPEVVEEIQTDNSNVPESLTSTQEEASKDCEKEFTEEARTEPEQSEEITAGKVDIARISSFGTEDSIDSVEFVPRLALEPDDDSSDRCESVAVPEQVQEMESTMVAEEEQNIEESSEVQEIATETLPEIEETIEEERPESLDETLIAVASLQESADANIIIQEDASELVQEESVTQLSEKDKKELEVLQKAVESITSEPYSESKNTVMESNKTKAFDESFNADQEPMISDSKQEEEEENKGHVEQDVEEKKDISERSSLENEVAETKANTTEVYKDDQKIIDSFSIATSSESKNEEIKTRREKEAKVRTAEKSKRHRKPQQGDSKLEELSINVDIPEKERSYSPKIIIKTIRMPEEEVSTTNSENEVKGSLKMTITKQSDKMHSILKICEPGDSSEPFEIQEEPIPKLIIKPKMQQVEQQHSPKMSTRSSKQVYSPTSSCQRSGSPRITIKPVLKPESVSPLKIKIGLKPEEGSKRHSPKLSVRQEGAENAHSPRKVTIKPIAKPSDEVELVHSPRITIKPIVKPDSVKVIKKLEEEDLDSERGRSSPKITIKPVNKPVETEVYASEIDKEVKERIVLKINKGNLPPTTPVKDSKKREHPDDDKSEKLAKITVKFSKGGGHHIVQPTEDSYKRSLDEQGSERVGSKRLKSDHRDVEVDYCDSNEASDDVRVIEEKVCSPIVISEDSRSQDSGSCIIIEDSKDASEMSMFEIGESKSMNCPKQDISVALSVTPPTPTPRKRGRPRKVPIEVREDFKDPEELPKMGMLPEPVQRVHESGRPKRSCRGQSARDTLGIKPRKPRGGGRGRGSMRGMGVRPAPMKPAKEPKLTKAKRKLLRDSLKQEKLLKQQSIFSAKGISKDLEIILIPTKQIAPNHTILASSVDEVVAPSISTAFVVSPPKSTSPKAALIEPEPLAVINQGSSVLLANSNPTDTVEIVMVDEETRMSAETSSRAQTPAKQTPEIVIEESQSSIQSTATTESGKITTPRPNKAPRLEVQEPEGAVISADQLTEYYWKGNGPFMLQEQVAQFLGIKSFKRKYPGIMRRMLDMQERDFIRESGLATEHMCDLGLTAVNSVDILDIMYSDFQDKYEEYCKHQRDRQAKELVSKQKALALAASLEKNKADILDQAVQSAAQWNAVFNKTRKEQRRACMDLQTLTVQFPKGKIKQINKPPIGNYPVSLVPGQFTDYYKEFTATEINNFPLNTVSYGPLNIMAADDSDDSASDGGSDSDSDSSTGSSSGSASDSSSGVEDCKLCKHTPKKIPNGK